MKRSPPIQTALRRGLNVGGGTVTHRVMSYNPFVSLQWMIDGRLADLAVLDEDYLNVPTAEISKLQSLLTIVGGKIVCLAEQLNTADTSRK
jgi:predicted amidohydrolase YtcJ